MTPSQMIRVNFIHPDGRRQQVLAPPGDTVMDAALDNLVAGIQAQCGGGCTCCTCHCRVRAPWFDRLPPAHQDELDLLAYAWGRGANSRLSCQVVLDASLDEIEVEVPARQS